MESTGRQIALEMARKFNGRDWMQELAERSGRPRETVEWHLQEDMVPPRDMQDAAVAMLARAEGTLQDGNHTADDLPLSGLPGNLGKLRQG